ncbi:hypothetical protein VNO80_13403 [Phaseolus coccineus]|uniref:Uncharacterized protein n=1 Tax=Phaseolus coccineus TaxID=3886 RepID=A0AAN9N646_PHACN
MFEIRLMKCFTNSEPIGSHGMYIDHLKERNLKDQMAKDSTEVIRKAILRMLPRNKLRNLLEGFLSSGSFFDGWKLHAKILKMAFCALVVLCEHLMDLYVALGDLFVAGKMTGHVLGLFRRMLRENVKLYERTYAGVLRVAVVVMFLLLCGADTCKDYITWL